MSKNLDEALDLMDAALREAAHDRLTRALTNARQLVDDIVDPLVHPQLVTDILAELEVARCAADAIRQADA